MEKACSEEVVILGNYFEIDYLPLQLGLEEPHDLTSTFYYSR
jgi:hypothetical protein